MRSPNQIEKAIVAALEPLIDDIVALEKRVEQMQIALEKRIERRSAQFYPGAGSPSEPHPGNA